MVNLPYLLRNSKCVFILLYMYGLGSNSTVCPMFPTNFGRSEDGSNGVARINAGGWF